MTQSLRDYDWILLNSSAGKDSQTMVGAVVDQARAEGVPLSRLVVGHADLGRIEWAGTRELAECQARHYGLRFEVVKREQGDLLEYVQARRKKLDADGREDTSPWPSPEQRWCTSDLKRGPMSTLITRLVEELRERRGLNPRGRKGEPVRVLNCMGMRAGESNCRAELPVFELLEENSRKRVYNWLPIHHWTHEEVWADIRRRGVPYHPAYDRGMNRLSCCFCIYAPREALIVSGHHNRELLDRYIEVEQQSRSTFKMGLSLIEIRDAVERGEMPTSIPSWEMP